MFRIIGHPGALLARLVCLARAPHPAATGGGFGLAPWENPGPRPPKAGAALSPTGQGKFRRDEQGCLVQKFVAASHRLADGAFAEVEGPDDFFVADKSSVFILRFPGWSVED